MARATDARSISMGRSCVHLTRYEGFEKSADHKCVAMVANKASEARCLCDVAGKYWFVFG